MDLRDDRPRGKVVRVSSALDLDLTSLVEETTRQVTESVMPALAQIKQGVETLAALMFPAGLMSDADSIATLTSVLPAGFLSGAATAQQVAAFQHERLTEAGYAVVPVAGAALEHAIQVAQHRQRLVEQGPAHGVPGVDVDRYEATARADARLAQARRNGQDDSWHEDDHH